MDSHYASELAEQLRTIERAVESGQDVTIRLVDGDRQLTMTFKGGQGFECSEPGAAPAGEKPPTLADNGGLLALARGSFAFDLQKGRARDPALGRRPAPRRSRAAARRR
jgi:hypothetical protein